MAFAICIKCGWNKRAPWVKCHHCGFHPKGDEIAMAQSIILSTRHWYEGIKHPPTVDSLQEIGQRIQSGEPYLYCEEDVQRLLTEIREYLKPWTIRDKWKVAIFLLLILALPLIGIIGGLIYLFH